MSTADGVEELDQSKLIPLLRLKYHDSIADAVADLGHPEEIGKLFASFQKYLYQKATVMREGEKAPGNSLDAPSESRLKTEE